MKRRKHRATSKNNTYHQPLDLFELIGQVFGAEFSKYIPPPPPPTIVECSIPSDMYRKLLMLCHPDKHGNSELSQEVTRWLIDERNKRR